MAGFTDAEGQYWTIRTALGDLIRVKDRLGLCLVDLTAQDRAERRAERDLARLADDVELTVNVLYVLCEPQAAEREITDVAFGERLDADAILHATAAVQEELTVFTLPRSLKDRGRKASQQRAATIQAHMASVIDARIDQIATVTAEELDALTAAMNGPAASSTSAGISPA